MITIFTPTYNRAYILPVLYQSLLRQSSNDFEWIIVDDGSTDDTKELVESWISATEQFQIRYYYQNNSGKHAAINYAVDRARYDWFFIVDSDDYLTDDAVTLIHEWIDTVEADEIAAISGTKCFHGGQIIGQCGVKRDQYIDAKNNERRKFKLLGDKAEIYRTNILRQFPFPVFPGERFIAESAVWDAIAIAGYKVRWFFNPIMVCAYLEDGLSEQLRISDLEVQNFEGFTYRILVELEAHQGVERIKIMCQYINKARKKGISLKAIPQILQIKQWQCYVLATLVCVKNIVRKLGKQ